MLKKTPHTNTDWFITIKLILFLCLTQILIISHSTLPYNGCLNLVIKTNSDTCNIKQLQQFIVVNNIFAYAKTYLKKNPALNNSILLTKTLKTGSKYISKNEVKHTDDIKANRIINNITTLLNIQQTKIVLKPIIINCIKRHEQNKSPPKTQDIQLSTYIQS